MNIKTFILAAGLLSTAVLTTSCSPYMNLVGRQESGLVTLTNTLANVHDLASADAAVSAVNNYGGLLMSDVTSLFEHGRPSLLDLMMLKSSYQNSNIKEQSKNCLGQVFRLASSNFYGSTNLRSSFVNMLRNAK